MFLVCCFFFPAHCLAQSEQEMEELFLLYDEKDLVISATRYPKPLSQVAENITVITSEEIEEINAHSLADILNRVPGLLISSNRDYNTMSSISTLGSETWHTLVLVDNIPWNLLNEGHAETSTIPVGIIERIEIIKGPASSSWGSALGGVINVITRRTGNQDQVSGSVYTSYGKNKSSDFRGEISGKAGNLGYYLYAQAQDSDGLVDTRSYKGKSFYSKLSCPVSDSVEVEITAGYSDPYTDMGDFSSEDLAITDDLYAFFSTSTVKMDEIFKGYDLIFSTYYYKNKLNQENRALGLGALGATGSLYLGSRIYNESAGIKAQIVRNRNNHLTVTGIDFEKVKMDQTIYSGSLLQLYGVPSVKEYSPDNTRWALYFNDTMSIGRWSVTPGIRLDYNNISNSFVSPSLGVTYLIRNDTLFRFSLARGFASPPLDWLGGGGVFLNSNPDLKSEEIWSYQAGVESGFVSFLLLKANIFFHDVENSFTSERGGAGPPTYNDIMINTEGYRRKGLEVAAQTIPLHGFSFKTGFAYLDTEASATTDNSNVYTYDISVEYKKGSNVVLLAGRYTWLDLPGYYNASYDDFIWELNVEKYISLHKNRDTRLFINIHNLFNGKQYSYIYNNNPESWLEAGFKFFF